MESRTKRITVTDESKNEIRIRRGERGGEAVQKRVQRNLVKVS